MTPKHFRAYTCGDSRIPMIIKWYVVYSTACYDFCTESEYVAERSKNMSKKEILTEAKTSWCRLRKIPKVGSRFTRPSALEAIKAMIQRKHRYVRCLRDRLSTVQSFLAYSEVTSNQEILDTYINAGGTV